jgi:uncharacterized protein (TIRG00374 family)
MKKRIISIGVSLIILTLIYLKIDFEGVVKVFAKSSTSILILGLSMFIPLLALTSYRLCLLMPTNRGLGFLESNRLNLMASVLNMVLPSKMGDIAKAAFMSDKGHLSRPLALSLVIFEKACDMASLLFWCAIGLVFLFPRSPLFSSIALAFILGGLILLVALLASSGFAQGLFELMRRFVPGKIEKIINSLSSSWMEMHRYFWENKGIMLKTSFISVIIWFFHLLQIWIFTAALHTDTPFLPALALSPLAILAGLLPFTFAGVGTRDAALVMLFAPYMTAADAAALGLLCTMRYFLPALAGLPLLNNAMQTLSIGRNK